LWPSFCSKVSTYISMSCSKFEIYSVFKIWYLCRLKVSTYTPKLCSESKTQFLFKIWYLSIHPMSKIRGFCLLVTPFSSWGLATTFSFCKSFFLASFSVVQNPRLTNPFSSVQFSGLNCSSYIIPCSVFVAFTIQHSWLLSFRIYGLSLSNIRNLYVVRNSVDWTLQNSRPGKLQWYVPALRHPRIDRRLRWLTPLDGRYLNPNHMYENMIQLYQKSKNKSRSAL